MKKSLIALAALAAVAGSAQAQSSVSIYGIIDSGYLSTESDGVRVSSNAQVANNTEAKGITSSASASSRLGFRGTEDLGGGMKAEFVFETNLAATNSTMSNMGNRQAFVGVNGGFGALRVGTQYTQHHTLAASLSPSVGVNMAGDLNYSAAGLTTSGAISNLGIVTTATALTKTSANVASEAHVLAANIALRNAGLNNAVLNTAGDEISTAATTGTVVAAHTGSDAADRARAVDRAQTLLNAAATASLSTRLALANMDGYTVRNNNTVMYTTPVMNGLQASVQYNAPTTSKIEGGNETKSTGQNLGLTYSKGKLSAGVAYGTGKNEAVTVTPTVAAGALSSLTTLTADDSAGTVAQTTSIGSTVAGSITHTALDTAIGTDGNALGVPSASVNGTLSTSVAGRTSRTEVKNQEILAGASYDFGFAKLGYTYSAKKAKDLTSDLIDRKSHSVNVSAPLSAKVSVWANYADGDQKIAVTNEYDLKAMQVGARYAFSKRTDAYAIYGQNKFDNKAAGAIDTKVTQYAFGLRHSF